MLRQGQLFENVVHCKILAGDLRGKLMPGVIVH